MFRDLNLKVTFGFTAIIGIAVTTLKVITKYGTHFLFTFFFESKFRTQSILDAENYF